MKTRHSLLFSITLLFSIISGCSSDSDDRVDDNPDDDGEPIPAPMITLANYESLVAQVFEVYTGKSYNEPLLALADDELLDAEVVEQTFTYDDSTPVEHTLFACEEGSAELDRAYGDGTDAGSFVNLTYRFDDCLDQGIRRSGSVEAYDGRYGPTVRSSALGFYTVPELATSFSGFVSLQWESPHRGPQWIWEARDVEWVTRTIDGDLALENMTSIFVAQDLIEWPIIIASLEGGFTLRSEATDGRAITASVTLPFSYRWDQAEPPESSGGQLPREDPDASWVLGDTTSEQLDNWYFESGQLELRAEDGSVLLLDADTGVPDTVTIALDNAVESTQFETSWSPWQLLLRLDNDQSTQADSISPQGQTD